MIDINIPGYSMKNNSYKDESEISSFLSQQAIELLKNEFDKN